MNALVLIDVATLTPETVFVPGGMEGIISKIEAEVRTIDRDISTPEGREAVKSLAYKVARSKTALDDMGKELVAGIKKQAGAIDADRKLARDRLDALKEEVRGPLTAWEDAEAARIDGHERALVCIVESPRFSVPQPSLSDICGRIDELVCFGHRDFDEFSERADAAYKEAIQRLDEMKMAAEQRERDQAELAELRRLKAEREEADRRQAAIEAAEIAAQQQAEREEQLKREQEARAAKLAEEAAARAVEAERVRVAAKKAADEAAERKRAENKRHRGKVELAVFDAICGVEGINDLSANLLLAALIAGRIPHVSITY